MKICFFFNFSQQLLRRSSEGGLGSFDIPPTSRTYDYTSTHNVLTNSSPMAARRAFSSMSGRLGPRSWHPSPFASDDDASSDEPQFFKEEKKNRIKMEIARRRQQIEENACLHEELTRLAKLRESAETSTGVGISSGINVPSSVMSPALATRLGYTSTAGTMMDPMSSAGGTTSVLKSVDEILRDGGISTYDPSFRASTMTTSVYNPELYSLGIHDRAPEFSPMNSDLYDLVNNPMRSRIGMTTSGLDYATASGLSGLAGDSYGKYSKSSALVNSVTPAAVASSSSVLK
jgi:hypothetical protein